ncbi:hypothetical protein [Posidoniimonas corsicana]|nr:hypothetical protein [Posidoniimonas corsicana]
MNRLLLITASASMMAGGHCSACLWDSDTLAMERQRFPGAHELIAGYFVRHSDAYYKWRIADRSAIPADHRRPIDYDDIAVAYDKLGQHDKAIDAIREKIQRWPDEHRYESEANLGTFLIHAGQLEEGLTHISNAIDINPEAHFGREVYQKLLVEYVIESRRQDTQLPLDKDHAVADAGFYAFVLAVRESSKRPSATLAQDAAKGVMGMMRFGQEGSPILLEALGDLLLADHDDNDSKHLAARAYLRASYEVHDPDASIAYREKAQQALEMQLGTDFSEVESELKREIEQGKDLQRQTASDEAAWISLGKDLDAQFAEKYSGTPSFKVSRFDWSPIHPVTKLMIAGLGVLVALVGLIALAVRYTARRITLRRRLT